MLGASRAVQGNFPRVRSITRYWRTVRHLRASQTIGRVARGLYRPRVDGRGAPDVRRAVPGSWRNPAARPPSLVGPQRVRLLNAERQIDSWEGSGAEKLWLYNLHYFDDLNASGALERRHWHDALIERWIVENAPASGTGWEPYPTSLRIVNWIKYALGGGELSDAARDSLACQARWLAKRVEWHVLGNHLFSNAKALIFVGAYFDGAEAEEWLRQGTSILSRIIKEHILEDGGHFERSPMYHSLALEDVLDLINLTRAFGLELGLPLRHTADRMRHWLQAMCHPDGDIAFFNDAAFGVAPSPEELEAYALRLGMGHCGQVPLGLTNLAASGYLRLQGQDVALIVDVAPLGPDYLPAHGHADTLSFELSIGGERCLVNSGTDRYGTGHERLRQRGTAAHNTVEIDGTDSSEVWAGFRVGRRARPFSISVSSHEGATTIAASHDGYRRLMGGSIHTRTWRCTPNQLDVIDSIEGKWSSAIARFHLHPAVRPVDAESGSVLLRLPSATTCLLTVAGGAPTVVDSTWHPEFGKAVSSNCVEVRIEGDQLHSHFEWKL